MLPQNIGKLDNLIVSDVPRTELSWSPNLKMLPKDCCFGAIAARRIFWILTSFSVTSIENNSKLEHCRLKDFI